MLYILMVLTILEPWDKRCSWRKHFLLYFYTNSETFFSLISGAILVSKILLCYCVQYLFVILTLNIKAQY